MYSVFINSRAFANNSNNSTFFNHTVVSREVFFIVFFFFLDNLFTNDKVKLSLAELQVHLLHTFSRKYLLWIFLSACKRQYLLIIIMSMQERYVSFIPICLFSMSFNDTCGC